MRSARSYHRALAVLAIVAVATLSTAQTRGRGKTFQSAFRTAGTVSLDLAAGEYYITPSPDDVIRVIAYDTSKHKAEETSVHISVKGNRADVEVNGPFNDGVKIDIHLPRHTNLIAALTAGEFNLKGITGSKNISARAGELDIEIGDKARYRRASASVRVGELNAAPFNVNKEGLFRSFSWNGKGSDDLDVSLWAGELRLH